MIAGVQYGKVEGYVGHCDTMYEALGTFGRWARGRRLKKYVGHCDTT